MFSCEMASKGMKRARSNHTDSGEERGYVRDLVLVKFDDA